ncbi:hypothetical protein CRUP_027900 [Coryphaenoides rupestris]|nr:hypothetical protein CRUP_027900 [Coryphaenoides rupestris]
MKVSVAMRWLSRGILPKRSRKRSSSTLLHFITGVIQQKYPDLASFHTELHFVDKAGPVSLDGVLQDIRGLERGMEMAKKEFLVQEDNVVLKDFVAANTAPLESLVKDGMKAQEAYGSVVEYFGENPKTTQPSAFFPTFVRFVKAYKKAQQENERKKKAELDGVDGVSVGTPSPRKPGERGDALAEPRDLAEAQQEAVLVRQLLQVPALPLVVPQQLALVVRRDEALQQLQEVQRQRPLVLESDRGGAYVSMAVQILSGFMPALRRVMARFLALLESMSETLAGAFWDTLAFRVVRSAGEL